MVQARPINAKSYYEYLPSSEHRCGDIWHSLPSIGLFSDRKTISGITITPACDVSNFKSETITYIPVLPVKEYLGTISLLPAIRREITERINSAKFDHNLSWPEPGYQPPTDEELASELSRIDKHCTTPSIKKADKDHLERALAGIRIARVCASSSVRAADLNDYAVLFGKKWIEMKKQIVKNSFRSDIHFLPADDQNSDETGLREHSVALLRFVISLPAELLTAAQHVAPTAWADYVSSYKRISVAAQHFEYAIPLKVLSLKSSFLADLVSRFSALYSRAGSPDFSELAIEKISGEIV